METLHTQDETLRGFDFSGNMGEVALVDPAERLRALIEERDGAQVILGAE